MAQTIVWGQIAGDRTITAGSGHFTVDSKLETGFCDVLFDSGIFNDEPAVTLTVLQPDTSGNAPVANLVGLTSSEFTLEIRSTESQDKYDLDFCFIAVGTSDDD